MYTNCTSNNHLNTNIINPNININAINSKSVLHEVELRKKKLQSEIHMLEKKLKKQEQLQTKANTTSIPGPSNKISQISMHSHQRVAVSPNTNKNDGYSLSGNKPHITHSPRSQLSGTKDKQSKPAISQNWKTIFKKQPIFSDPFSKNIKQNKIAQSSLWKEPSKKQKQEKIGNYLIQQYLNEYTNFL